MQSENVGQAADTSRWSWQQTESRWEKLASATHALRAERGCAPYHQILRQGRYFVADSFGATSPKWTLSNHDQVPPLQCWAKRENDSRPSPFLLEVKGSIVQFHLFEYEMSREFVRGKSRIMTQK